MIVLSDMILFNSCKLGFFFSRPRVSKKLQGVSDLYGWSLCFSLKLLLKYKFACLNPNISVGSRFFFLGLGEVRFGHERVNKGKQREKVQLGPRLCIIICNLELLLIWFCSHWKWEDTVNILSSPLLGWRFRYFGLKFTNQQQYSSL